MTEHELNQMTREELTSLLLKKSAQIEALPASVQQ
jgi:hypothetical protein